mgnify:CR=1 FL=1
MKNTISFLGIFLVVFLTITNGQIYKPSYQSNNSLDFSTFLGGVKYAYIFSSDEDIKTIEDNPTGGNAYAISGVISYLKAIGFTDVKWGTLKNLPQNIPSICELMLVYVTWKVEGNTYTNISVNYYSCNNDIFRFETSKNIVVNSNTNISTSFHNIFMEMYGYNKKLFSTYNRLSLPSENTEWTEVKLKNYFNEKGVDEIEGIYENTISTPSNPKYKLGIIKINDIYTLIYLSGATNYLDWKEGEIKAKLTATATQNLFKADWKMSNKGLNTNAYIGFETGLMNLVIQEKDKSVYLKLFPTANDNITTTNNTPSSGTGFAISAKGYIITCNHVIDGATSIKIRGVNGDFSKTFTAKVVTSDINNDLAILKIDDVNFATFGTVPYVIKSTTSEVGANIYILGYPLRATMGDEIKLTDGIISAKSGFKGDITSYQISAAAQPGNSGGPLFDKSGNLIGVVNAKHVQAESATYAVKSNYLISLLESLPTTITLQKVNGLVGKNLTDQVKMIRNFVFIIEVN